MKTAFTTRSYSPLAPNYKNNAVLHLVIICAVSFILLHMVSAVFMVLAQQNVFKSKVLPFVALQAGSEIFEKPWTLLSYFILHSSFWTLLSNMVWLYCFGSVIQALLGHKEIIPLFIISSVIAGACFVIATNIWPQMSGTNTMVLTAQPGIIAFAVGAITLAPSYRYYLGERLAIPLWVLLAVYILISCMVVVQGNNAMLILLAGAALCGFGYIKLLKNGYRPGAWLYNIGTKFTNIFTPKAERPWPTKEKSHQKLVTKTKKEQLSADYIDAILDKINQKGYSSLTSEEKEALLKASKES
jgi:membrane associated rhomboid family serine protease